MIRTLISIVEDDPVSRELMLIFAAQAGFAAEASASGDAELARLRSGAAVPAAILTDMQMPGVTGAALAQALRVLCGAGTRLIAMSGSKVAPERLEPFDDFLLKPFGPEELRAAVLGDETEIQEEPIALSEATYTSLAQGMPAGQLHQLYAMCLEDAERRIGLMRQAAAAEDGDAWVRGAHAIKGGCGMVGALQLASLAEAMEQDGPPGDGDLGALDEFLVALSRLRRILDAIGK